MPGVNGEGQRQRQQRQRKAPSFLRGGIKALPGTQGSPTNVTNSGHCISLGLALRNRPPNTFI